MGSSQQEHSVLPPEVVAALGTPEDVYAFNPVIQWLCWLTALLSLGPAAMCFWFLVQPFGKNPPPPVVALCAGLAFVAAGAVLAGLAMWYRSLTFVTFPQALVKLHGRAFTIIPWESITEVWVGTAPVGNKYWLSTCDGQKLFIDYKTRRAAALGDSIQERVTAHLLPAALESLAGGGAVSFGPLGVSCSGLRQGKHELAWMDVCSVRIEYNPQARNTLLEVRKKASLLPWCSLGSHKVPNLPLFIELVRHAAPHCLT